MKFELQRGNEAYLWLWAYSVACQDKGSLDCGGIGFAVIMIEGAYQLFAKGWGWLRKVACSLFVLGWLRLARSLIAK